MFHGQERYCNRSRHNNNIFSTFSSIRSCSFVTVRTQSPVNERGEENGRYFLGSLRKI